MDEQKPFSQRLREWRGKRRQKEVSEILGVSRRTIEAWEQGWSKPTTDLSMREIEQRMKETASQ